MKTIDYSDFNHCGLKDLTNGFMPKNKFYLDEKRKIIYKIFNDFSIDECNKKGKTIELLNELNKDYIPKVHEILKDNVEIKGYSQDYIQGETLHKLLIKRGILENIKTIIEVSKNMEDLHNSEGNPVIGDMHFENIIVDQNNKPIFIDIDSFGIGNLEADNIPLLLWRYLEYHNMDITKNQNTDRLCLILNLLYKTIGRDVTHLAEFAYQDYAYTYSFLKGLQPVFIELKRAKSNVPEVPYLHKVLKNYEKS